jgi:hypothetical protein
MVMPQTVSGVPLIGNQAEGDVCIESSRLETVPTVRIPTGPPGKSQQSSATKTITPLDAMFCGVFRLYLLTSPTPQMSFLGFWRLRAVSLETS